jgi:hypothetical protein
MLRWAGLALVCLSGCFADDPFPEVCNDAEGKTCPGGYFCRDYVCRKVCEASSECGVIEACLDHICMPYQEVCTDHRECADGWYCSAEGSCARRRDLGLACDDNAVCASGFCADGVCCDGECAGACLACSADLTGGLAGTCAFTLPGNVQAGDCATDIVCDGAGACDTRTLGESCGEGTQCTSGSCVDGTCCESACDGECEACSALLTGVSSGTCAPVPRGDDAQEECTGGLVCDGSRACFAKVEGGACEDSGECVSEHCVDGVCCESACDVACSSCSTALTGAADGQCEPTSAGSESADECAGALACNGSGTCFAKSTGSGCSFDYECLSEACVDGVCCASACDGICEACASALTGDADGVCAPIPDGDDPAFECSGTFGCDGARECVAGAENGVACGQNEQCASAHCVDDVCCESACDGTCEACSMALTGAADGACEPIAEWDDPELECSGWACDGGRACKPAMSWTTPGPIETDNAGDAGLPRVAVGASGTAFVAWEQYDGVVTNVWANRYVPGLGWQTPVMIEQDSVASTRPAVAVDASGNAIVVWRSGAGSTMRVKANRFVPGTGWGSPLLIDSLAGSVFYVEVVVDSAGNAVATWAQSDGTRYSAWSNRYSVGPGWGTAGTLESSAEGVSGTVRIASNSRGDVVATWTQNASGTTNAWVKRYVAGSGWGAAELLENDSQSVAGIPGVAVDAGGGAHFIWAQAGVIWSRSHANGAWTGRELVATGNVMAPQIGTDFGGNTVVTWTEYVSIDDVNVWSSFRQTNSSWQPSQMVANNIEDGQVDMACDGHGNAVLIWNARPWSAQHFSYFAKGLGWSASSELAPPGTAVRAAYGADGPAMAAWADADGVNDIWAAVFD